MFQQLGMECEGRKIASIYKALYVYYRNVSTLFSTVP
jgi:hypothetical protein